MIGRTIDELWLDYDYHEILDSSDDGPSLEVMWDYDLVIWFTGEARGARYDETVTEADETSLAAYLDAGGRLLLSSQDFLRDRYSGYGQFSAGQFPFDYLGLDKADQDCCQILHPAVASAAGVAGSLADGLECDLEDVYGSPVGLCPDLLYAREGAQCCLEIVAPSTCPCAVQYTNPLRDRDFRSLFTTASLAAIPSLDDRVRILAGALDWLGPSHILDASGFDVVGDNRAFGLMQNVPNPFNPTTEICFALQKRGWVSLEIYDARGMLVVTLLEGQRAAGPHSVSWDGRDHAGAEVASGLYFCRLVTENATDTVKMVLLK